MKKKSVVAMLVMCMAFTAAACGSEKETKATAQETTDKKEETKADKKEAKEDTAEDTSKEDTSEKDSSDSEKKEAEPAKLVSVDDLSDYVTVGEYKGLKLDRITQSVTDDDVQAEIDYDLQAKGDEVKDGPLALGMHKKNTFHDIVNITDCQIVDNDYNLIVKCALNIAQQMELPFYHKMRHEGYFRHLVVRRAESSGDILVNIVTTLQAEADLTKLRDALLELPLSGKIIGILHTTNDSLADVVQADKIDILYGQDYFYEEILGLKFKISPFSFFQTNTLGAEVLCKTARDFVGETKDKVIFDLYSGTGTIAQMLAPVAKKVVGVEIVEEAVEAAKVNAELNGLDNCEFIAGDVLKVVDELEDKPDFIVLDPPRDGIHPKAIQKIIDFGVEQMVYISCKPTSLARDLEVFEAAGYKVKRATAVDQFPNTVHIESIVLIQKVDI